MILPEESFRRSRSHARGERLGLGILAALKQSGEIVVCASNVGMILAEGLFVDLDRASKERFGFAILPLVLKCTRQIVVSASNVGMILPREFSSISIARRKNGSASASLPWL